jgi:hypothetical protein
MMVPHAGISPYLNYMEVQEKEKEKEKEEGWLNRSRIRKKERIEDYQPKVWWRL